MGMCRDQCDTCVMLMLQAAFSKLMRAPLGLSAAVSVLCGISEDPSCPLNSAAQNLTRRAGQMNIQKYPVSDILPKTFLPCLQSAYIEIDLQLCINAHLKKEQIIF